MIISRNEDTEMVAVTAIQDQPVYGGELMVKPLISGDEMMFMEVHYTAGVGAPLHVHAHESLIYVVTGKVSTTVGDETFVLGPGDVCRHPKGVPHGVEALEDSLMIEIKAPAPDMSALFQLARATQP